jgi:hypothetical protein
MNIRNRVLMALEWKMPDAIAFTPKPNHAPRDPDTLRKLMDLGMGLAYPVSVFTMKTPNVNCNHRIEEYCRISTYSTPVGILQEKTRINLPSEGGERSSEWLMEPMFKGYDDYRAIRYIIDDEVCEPSYEEAERAERESLSEEARSVVFTGCGYAPLMELVTRFMGFQRLAVELRRHPGEIGDLIDAMDKKHQEAMRLVAKSPARIVEIGDNIDSVLINPPLFEKYCLSYYQRCCDLLHGYGKVVGSHMDGRLRSLKELIRETGLDFIDAFTPPPMGDLGIRECREAWDEDIAQWVNIPGVIFYYSPQEIRAYVKRLLMDAAPGKGLAFGITESVPSSTRDAVLEIIIRTVAEYGKCPIREGK